MIGRSGRVYDSLEMMEFYFGSPRPASDSEYVTPEVLREGLPYLVEHGMLKISDPNVYVLQTRMLPRRIKLTPSN